MISQFSGAVFDQHRAYRFILWRFWNDSPRVLFIGLNPSTANELQNDPTIRRCLGFAEKWGYGGMFFCNLYSYISTDPRLLSSEEALHAANIPAITMATSLSVLTVAAWGDGVELVENGKSVAEHVEELVAPSFCFGMTQKGNPKHPLYLPSDAELVELI
ncbi:hypothetical protein ES703_124479 [subsurface metagenome]